MDNIADATALPVEQLRRDQDFWLEDGSVVLVAKRTAFKVYAGLLSVHSPVFSNMFSSVTHADETYDGCPVVRVSDSPEDLQWVLSHVIPKTLRHLEQSPDMQYPELSALARLGHKYQIDLLERHAIARLTATFTNDLEQWEGRLRCPQVPSSSSYLRHNPIDVINIARLTGNPSMLPLAFCLCAQNLELVVDGQARGDGTHLFLSKPDAKRCIAGLRGLYRASQGAVQQTVLATCQSGCRTPAACLTALDAMLKRASQGGRIYLLEGLNDIFFLPFTGCSTCSQAIEASRQEERRELWKRLPQIFGLQEELKGHWPGY